MSQSILIIGGGGFVGTVLTQRLLDLGYTVRVLDTFWFGDFVKEHANLTKIKGDMRDQNVVDQALSGIDTVIQLACLSNDPTSDLDPELTKDVNYTACKNIIHQAKAKGIKRFIYASSASVYGVRDEANITEDMVLAPITLYSQYKADIEEVLLEAADDEFTTVAVRNSTVSGYSPRMRLDLIISIFVMLAMKKGSITIEGGQQLRPLIHMEDLIDFYVLLLEADREKIHRQAFNVSSGNFKVLDVAEMVKERIPCDLEFVGYTDPRSYHVSTDKVHRVLGYQTKRPIAQAIEELKGAFAQGIIDSADSRCYNIKHLKVLMENNGLKSY